MSLVCPCCAFPLTWGGRREYETLQDHVSGFHNSYPRSFWYCTHPYCDCSKPEDDRRRKVLVEIAMPVDPQNTAVFWDECGDIYGWISGIKFLMDNNAPFGSIARRLNAEQEKREDRKKLLEIFGYRFMMVNMRVCDEMGLTVSTSRRFDCWRKDGGGYILVHSWIRMWLFYYEVFRRALKDFETRPCKNTASKLLKEFDEASWDKRTYRVIFRTFLKLFYFRKKNKACNIVEGKY